MKYIKFLNVNVENEICVILSKVQCIEKNNWLGRPTIRFYFDFGNDYYACRVFDRDVDRDIEFEKILNLLESE